MEQPFSDIYNRLILGIETHSSHLDSSMNSPSAE